MNSGKLSTVFFVFNPLPSDVVVTPVTIKPSWREAEALPARWVLARSTKLTTKTTVIIYLHGGGYLSGSFTSHGGLVAEIAKKTGAAVLFVDYRLCPEHPLPAALEDSMDAYLWLRDDQGYSADQIIIMGDSAGGGLTLLTLLALRDGNIPLPAGAVALSAWTDLSSPRASQERNRDLDPMLGGSAADDPFVLGLAQLATGVADPEERKNPKIYSPLYADSLAGLPPLLFIVGGDECLEDDTLDFAQFAVNEGLDVQLIVGEGQLHVYPMFHEFLPEARDAILAIKAFVDKHAD